MYHTLTRTLPGVTPVLLCLLLSLGCVDSSGMVSIEGEVSSGDGCGTGPVIVFALPAEHAPRYRFIETETPARAAPEVAGYARLDGPGTYRIDGLGPGNYTVYAWQDSNENGGINTAISQPVTMESRYPPSLSLESDAFGDGIRFPGEIWPHDRELILTTNIFFVYEGVCLEAVAATGAYHAGVGPTNYRYTDMARLAEGFIADGDTIGTPEMVALLQAASTSREYRGQTEYSFIAYPDQMSFSLASEDLDRKVLDAPFARYERFGFGEEFG